LTSKLKALSKLAGNRLLDVGCGDGSITMALSNNFLEVFAIDVQAEYLSVFRRKLSYDSKFRVELMSAEKMTFPDEYFDTIVCIETIEHIANIDLAASEMGRVLKTGGELLITCPNRFFPFENHGMRLLGREIHTRIPLLPYIPPLHRKFALARVFSVRALKNIFSPVGLHLTNVDYAWPTFEHGGNPLQPCFKPLFGLMRKLENSPIRMFGSSIVARFVKLCVK